jgi:hypothetical protein
MDITITAARVEIDPVGYKKITVSLEDIDTDDLDDKSIAEEIPIQTFIDAHGTSDILETIGKDEVIKHFGITEAEEV